MAVARLLRTDLAGLTDPVVHHSLTQRAPASQAGGEPFSFALFANQAYEKLTSDQKETSFKRIVHGLSGCKRVRQSKSRSYTVGLSCGLSQVIATAHTTRPALKQYVAPKTKTMPVLYYP
jgi:hypothetical protein